MIPKIELPEYSPANFVSTVYLIEAPVSKQIRMIFAETSCPAQNWYLTDTRVLRGMVIAYLSYSHLDLAGVDATMAAQAESY